MGARIEMLPPTSYKAQALVAPLVGARIEMKHHDRTPYGYPVAPLVGARIEITAPTSLDVWHLGRSPRGSED